jgi:hypothetical protein
MPAPSTAIGESTERFVAISPTPATVSKKGEAVERGGLENHMRPSRAVSPGPASSKISAAFRASLRVAIPARIGPYRAVGCQLGCQLRIVARARPYASRTGLKLIDKT